MLEKLIRFFETIDFNVFVDEVLVVMVKTGDFGKTFRGFFSLMTQLLLETVVKLDKSSGFV